MCGRTACTLEPDDICRACCFKDRHGNWKVPEWKDAPNGKQYYPSYNVAPTSYTPVMISKKHYLQECKDERVIQPMYWGMVPFWHKGELKDVNLSTNNARIETLVQKPMFNVPLKKGRRCVVLADGYYEWQKSGKGGKQPYFIYFPQPDGIKVESHSWKEDLDSLWSKDYGWGGPRPLTMAGVFDIWTDQSDDKEVFSYAVVTMDASSSLSFIHDRMPAILDGTEAIESWLDFENVPIEQALKLIVPCTKLTWHPVSTIVGNSRNKSPECIQPIDLKPKVEVKGNPIMKNWLMKGSPAKNKSVVKQENIVKDEDSVAKISIQDDHIKK